MLPTIEAVVETMLMLVIPSAWHSASIRTVRRAAGTDDVCGAAKAGAAMLRNGDIRGSRPRSGCCRHRPAARPRQPRSSRSRDNRGARAPRREAADGLADFRWRGKQQLIDDRLLRRGARADRDARGRLPRSRGERQRSERDRGAGARGIADMTKVGQESVGDVEHRMRDTDGRGPSSMRGSGNWKRWISAARSAGARAGYRPRSTWSPRKASPIVPLTQIRSPGLAPLRRISAPTATSPIAVSDSTAGPEVATESPPRRSTPKRG